MVPSALAYKTQVSKKLRVTDESDQKIARPQTPATSVQDHPVCNRTLALKAIAATAPVRLQLQSMLFNNRTRFGSGKLLNFNKCDTLQALFTQIHNSYRFLFDDLHLSTRGICFFRLRLSLNSSSKETSHKSRKIDREGHAEWERAFEVMKTFVDGKGAKALDSLLLEVHFDALLVFETTPHTSED